MPSHYCEFDYLRSMIASLKDSLDDKYNFYILHNDIKPEFSKYKKEIKKNKKINIAIHISNEDNYDKRYYKYFDLIFRFYLPHKCDFSRVFPINIGYNSSGDNKVQFINYKKLSKRKNDVFFIGQKGVRPDFYSAMKDLTGKYKIIFTDSFRSGYILSEYLEELSESKICLVPNGVSPETFRYTEAFASGCIVVTKKIDVWYYNNSPAYFINDWEEVNDEYIKAILNSDIDKMYEQNLNYYEEYLSPKANANYIIGKIKAKYNY